ncbi:MAG: hypothetical protein GF334_12930 [Candidatus Altiarchaeales archaeon]|nr:hypothetical protein [Candidatus Altiarchaeales archaeon]
MMDDSKSPLDEWRRIHTQEQSRKERISDLRRVILKEQTRQNKNAKSLLRLIVHGGELNQENASQMLGVDQKIVTKWAEILSNRNLIEIDGAKKNPLYKPTKTLLKKISAYEQKKHRQKQTPLLPPTPCLGEEKKTFIETHRNYVDLSDELAEKNQKISSLKDSLEKEKNLRKQLTHKLEELQGKSETEKIKTLKDRLNREHKERLKVEEILKKERQQAQKRKKEIQKQQQSKADELKHRARQIQEKEKTLQEDEELDILFGDDPVDERIKQSQTLLSEILDKLRSKSTNPRLMELARMEQELLDQIKEEHRKTRQTRELESLSQTKGDVTKTVALTVSEEEDRGKPITPQEEDTPPYDSNTAEHRPTKEAKQSPDHNTKTSGKLSHGLGDIPEPIAKETEAEKPVETEKPKPQPPGHLEKQSLIEDEIPNETKIKFTPPAGEASLINLMELLGERKQTSFKQAQTELGVSEDKLDGWVEHLSEKKIVETQKPIIGSKKILLSPHMSIEALKELIDAAKIRQELKNLK